MMEPRWARSSQVWAGKKVAAVFSMLPSGVGVKSAVSCFGSSAGAPVPFGKGCAADGMGFESSEGRK